MIVLMLLLKENFSLWTSVYMYKIIVSTRQALKHAESSNSIFFVISRLQYDGTSLVESNDIHANDKYSRLFFRFLGSGGAYDFREGMLRFDQPITYART